MTPNFVHMHLLLNHVPTVGTIVALGILIIAAPGVVPGLMPAMGMM